MLLARLVCSDPDCAETLELTGASLDELSRELCACGCGLELLAVSALELLGPRRPRLRLVRLAPPPSAPDALVA